MECHIFKFQNCTNCSGTIVRLKSDYRVRFTSRVQTAGGTGQG